MAFRVFPLKQILMISSANALKDASVYEGILNSSSFLDPVLGYLMNRMLMRTFHSGQLCKNKLVEDVVYTCNIKCKEPSTQLLNMFQLETTFPGFFAF